MEKKSKYSWILAGYRPKEQGEKIEEAQLHQMATEAFIPDKIFQLFLCGAFVDKSGTLEEMEAGLDIIIEKMKDYHDGDYCIVSSHEKGDLLFIPIKEE